jgi:hypothetical protein
MKKEKESITVDKNVLEWDSNKTASGLPAPDGWHITDFIHSYHQPEQRCGYFWERLTGQRLKVMEDVAVKADGKRWLHVSVSKPNHKMPTYDDLQEVRRLFIGEDRESYMVFPTKDRYVNIHNVLHLWSCLDQPSGVLPHFEEVISLDGEQVVSV